MRVGLVVLGLSLIATPVMAQAVKTCEDQLQEALVRVDLAERDAANARQAAAQDIARWLNRAQAAEKKVAAVPQPEKPAEPKPEASSQGK